MTAENHTQEDSAEAAKSSEPIEVEVICSSNDVVVAEMVADAPLAMATALEPSHFAAAEFTRVSQPATLGPRLENLAAKGGAVAAIVLGVLAVVGSFATSWSIVNALMGLAAGAWGLRSQHRKIAMVGILLCLIGAFFSAVEISDWLRSIWPVEEENY